MADGWGFSIEHTQTDKSVKGVGARKGKQVKFDLMRVDSGEALDVETPTESESRERVASFDLMSVGSLE